MSRCSRNASRVPQLKCSRNGHAAWWVWGSSMMPVSLILPAGDNLPRNLPRGAGGPSALILFRKPSRRRKASNGRCSTTTTAPPGGRPGLADEPDVAAVVLDAPKRPMKRLVGLDSRPDKAGAHNEKSEAHSWRLPACGTSDGGALDRIRTYGLLLRRQPLYPLSYEGAATAAAEGNEKELSRCRTFSVKPCRRTVPSLPPEQPARDARRVLHLASSEWNRVPCSAPGR